MMRGAGRDYQLAAEAANDANICRIAGVLAEMHKRTPEALRMVAHGSVTAREKRDGTVVLEGAGVLGKVIREAVLHGLIERPVPSVGNPITLALTPDGELALQI